MEKKEFKIKYKVSEDDLKNDPEKVKDTFLKNISDNSELRKELWIKLYWDMKAKITYRNNKDLMINVAEKEWSAYDETEKLVWYDIVTDNGKALSTIGEINYIAKLVTMHKGNMKKVWKDLKLYGKMKKEEQ